MIEQILSPAIVRALGWTLIHTLWQAALFALLLGGLLVLLRKYSSITRYGVAIGVLVAFFLTSGLTISSLYQAPTEVATAPLPEARTERSGEAEEIPIANNEEQAYTSQPLPFKDRFVDYFNRHLPLIVTLWLMGVLILQLRFIGQLTFLQRLRNYGTERFPARYGNLLRELEEKIGLNRPVTYLRSFRVKSPFTIGWLNPAVLFPTGLLAALDEAQLRTILAHELAHIKRHDFAVNLLQAFLCILFFYHPAVWWISRRIEEEREHCCDDLAIAVTGEKVGYAKTLIQLKEAEVAGVPLAMAYGGNGKGLQGRIKRLLTAGLGTGTYGEGFTTAVIIALCIGLAINLSAQDNENLNTPDTMSTQEEDNPKAPEYIRPSPGLSEEEAAVVNELMQKELAKQGRFENPDESQIDKDPFALFMDAIYEGREDLVRYFLDEGKIEDLNRTDNRPFTPLMAAVSENHTEITRLLLAAGAEVNFVDTNGWTALHEAADEGSYDCAQLLIKAGADVNLKGRNEERSPLAMAASEGHMDVFTLLVQSGADVLSLSGEKHPLHEAAEEGQLQAVRTILSLGTDVNVTDQHGRTALSYAAEEGHTDVIRELLEAGADAGAVDYGGRTPLSYAAEEGELDAFDALAGSEYATGGDANPFKTKSSVENLLRAAREGQVEIVRRLIEDGVDVNSTDANGNSALAMAAREGEFEVARYLLGRGARADGPENSSTCTPLFLAAREGESHIIRLLVGKGGSMENGCDFRDAHHHDEGEATETAIYQGATPLLVAISEGNNGTAAELIRLGADPNSTSYKISFTHMRRLTYQEIDALTLDKLRQQATLNYEADGWTPLFEAVAANRKDIVRMLLRAKANPNQTTKQGLTPAQLARDLGYSDIASLLR